MRDQELGFVTVVDCEEPIVICWRYGVASEQLRGLCEMQKLDHGILKYNYVIWCLRIGLASRFSECVADLRMWRDNWLGPHCEVIPPSADFLWDVA